MALSAVYGGFFSARPNHELWLTIELISQNVAGNYSTVKWTLDIVKVSGVGSRSSSPHGSASVVVAGQNWSRGGFTYDTNATSVVNLGSGHFNVAHDADGTGKVASAGAANSDSTLGNAFAGGELVLPTIARATQPTVSPTSGNTGATYTINHSPASGDFRHDVAYSLDGGGSYTDIATGANLSTSWTPAHALLPSTTSATAIIRVITRASAGGTVIGTKTVNLPLTVPATVKPTISSVLFADAQTTSPNIPSLMGGVGRFVQRWSKLIPTVTAAGAGGSTVTGSSVTQAGQVTPSGTAFGQPVGLSGNVPYSAQATDSRGVVSDPYANTVAVTAYNFPNLPTPLVTRTEDAAGSIPSPTGTYLAITPGASVSSLMFGGAEKNLLEWQVRTRPAGGAWTTKQAWTATGVSGNTWTTKFVPGGGYLADTEYEVEVSIRDVFGKNGFNTAQTVSVVTVGVPSERVFMVLDGDDGVGFGGYRRPEFLVDIHGPIGQNGNAVLDATFRSEMDLLFDALLPIGVHLPGEFSASPSPRLLVPDGAIYNIADYPRLAAHYLATYGARNKWGGNGTTTFAVPDTREYVYVNQGGVDRFTPLGAKTGAKTHSLTAAENGPHTHGPGTSGAFVTYTDGAGLANWAGGANQRIINILTTGSSGSGTPHNNVQPSFVVKYLIRAA